jgi:tRNA pseudouridine38-40 synthase
VEKISGKFQRVIAAGRTDAGVHAMAQVAHVDIERDLTAYNVMHGLNYYLLALTKQVVVTGAEQVGDDFHARFSATGRSYRYRIINRPARLALEAGRAWHIPELLDAGAMHEAAQLLLGNQDFTTFRSTMCQAKSAAKTLDRLEVGRKGDEITVRAEARSFLHHQVRNMVGALRLIGNKKWTPGDLQSALRAKDRRAGGETAPPQGLSLVHVFYGGVA